MDVRVLTVGAGASPLVGVLLELGCMVIAVDIASSALDALVAGLSDDARVQAARGRFTTIVGDVRCVRVDQPVDVWHDRAVFHFLVDRADRTAYAHAASTAVVEGGHLVIATFAPSGPTSCSGLPVMRHDGASLQAEFGPHFQLIEAFELDHRTPWGADQRFTHAILRRTGHGDT